MKVKIENYQVIKEAELEFKPGINAIIGSTNNGKSAIIRAIRGAINNQGGNGFINYNADSCLVDIKFNGHNVIWKKTKKQGKSSYTIDGVVLKKIGQKQLEEVASIMNMPEIQVNNDRHQINFWRQLDKPFLVDKTPYQLFDFIVKSDEQEIIRALSEQTELSLKEINKHITSTSAAIDANTELINTLITELKDLERFRDIDVDRLELMINLEKTIYDLLAELDNTRIESRALLDKILKSTDFINEATALLASVYTEIDNLQKLEEYLSELDLTTSNITSVIENIDLLGRTTQDLEAKVAVAKQLENTTESLEQEYTTLNELFILIDKCNKDIISYTSLIDQYTTRIEKLSDELKQFIVCPLCGNNLDSNHGGHNEFS